MSNSINAQLPNHAIWSPGQTQLIIDNDELPEFHFFLILSGLTPGENVSASQQNATETEAYVKRIIENPISSHTFPTMRWLNYYDDKNSAYQDWINFYENGETIPNTTHEEKEWEHTFIPTVFLQHAVQSITQKIGINLDTCLLYTSPSPRDRTRSRMPSSA